jgi:hypothetical protein
MSTASKLSETQVVTQDGIVTATVYDRIAVDHLYDMLLRGAYAAKYARSTDSSELVDRTLKALVVDPRKDV